MSVFRLRYDYTIGFIATEADALQGTLLAIAAFGYLDHKPINKYI